MPGTVDEYLLMKLCDKHDVSAALVRRLIEEFASVESTKKHYLKTIIEDEWDKYEH